ncbi:hypothetical protein CXY01_23340 [Cellulomonas xylanilytica]|uniref:Uncharacterized protein n=1 Tax=Cellulomonas xylanilytica TaxID=233583 RepID=A0A510V4K8_9CELL|nr:hypothetical protein CXY01_23340 [Cellulomonas xylanilytica]
MGTVSWAASRREQFTKDARICFSVKGFMISVLSGWREPPRARDGASARPRMPEDRRRMRSVGGGAEVASGVLSGRPGPA